MARFVKVLAVVLLSMPIAADASFFFTRQGRLQVFDREVRYRVEGAKPLTIDEAIAESASWPATEAQPVIKYGEPGTAWLRIDVPQWPGVRRMLFTASAWEAADFYLVRDGRLVAHQRSGTLVPWNERTTHVTMTPAISHAGMVEFERGTGPLVLIARLHTDARYVSIERARLLAWDADVVAEGEKFDRIVQGFFYGVMLFLVLYNLGLFIAWRDPSHFWYAVMEGGFTLAWMVLFGITFEFAWPAHPQWDYPGIVYACLIGAIGVAQFLRHYLDTQKLFPRMDLVLRIAAWTDAALIAIVTVLPHPYGVFVPALPLSTPLGAALIIGVIGYAFKKRHPLAPNLMLAMSLMCAGMLVYTTTELGWVRANDLTTQGGQIGSALMGIVLSWGLSLRLQRQREAAEREKLAFVEEQNRALEARVVERTAELQRAQEQSEALLANILPAAVIEELRAKGEAEPRRHEEATILFTDFKGFTQTVATIPPRRLVRELDEIFRAFDDIVVAHGLEKIKTIGDAYMVAAGLPRDQADHAVRCVRAGLAMMRFIEERNTQAALKWGLRVGVHSGAVVAGVVGKNKYAYDVWGDTVNIASRLESSGEAGRVNISAYTYELVRDRFECEYRGKIAAKGKGDMDMYFVVREKVAAAAAQPALS